MKNLIKSLSVLSLLVALILFHSCKKPKYPPADSCKNLVTVTAMDPDMYSTGHFTLNDNQLAITWLFADNWSAWANKVVPGRKYRIGYAEVECNENKGWCGNTGIAAGGCIPAQRKCIEIKCLTEVPGCFASLLNVETFAAVYSCAVSSTGINGNSLNAKVGFSGCSANGKLFKLYLNLQTNRCGTPPIPNDVWIAKAVNNNNEVTCSAYFEKDVCFDLSSVRDYYLIRNSAPPPAEVTIRVMTNANAYSDYIYKF